MNKDELVISAGIEEHVFWLCACACVCLRVLMRSSFRV